MTKEELKRVLKYDPETGLFTWVNPHQKSNKKKGDVAGHKTSRDGYCYIRVNKKLYSLHRLAYLYMTGVNPDQIDHINRDTSDNRWSNLRSVNQQENLKNKSLYKNNKSGVSGVHFDTPTGKWEVRIRCNNQRYYFGRYQSLEDAIRVRNVEYARLGFQKSHGK